MKASILSIAFIFICLLSCLHSHAQASGGTNSTLVKAEDVLKQMETTGNSLTYLVASLWKQKTNTQLRLREDPELGTIYYSPGKKGDKRLRIDIFETTKDAKATPKIIKTVVIKGDNIKLYEPEVQQLLETSISKESKGRSIGSLAITLGSVAAIRAGYEVNYVKEEKIKYEDQNTESEATWVLHLTPKTAGPYKSIDIWVSQTQGLPIQQRLVENNGDITILQLSNLKKNMQFDIKKLIDDFNPPNVKRVKG
jgi:outer membrane lipoprotein-sorting protein